MMKRASPPARGIFPARLVKNAVICREHFLLTFEVSGFPEAHAGQFVQVACGAPRMHQQAAMCDTPLLRRPFSIAGLRRSCARVEIDLLGRIVGPGTAWLAALRPGDETDFLGPLGRPFTIDEHAAVHVLVAGGVGLPPLLWLAEKLHEAGRRAIAVCGATTADLLPLHLVTLPRPDGVPAPAAEAFAHVNTPVVITTDDGSLGLRGRASDGFEKLLALLRDAESVAVYTCGPEPMMRAVARICSQHRLHCQVCLERVMACGMGTCQSCVVRVRDDENAPDSTNVRNGRHYELCCKDGPVFDAARVVW
jgi:dihydroorotate dehydrogenase electron transfer subunit